IQSKNNDPIELGTMGFNGYLMSKTNPSKHIIDRMGLADPFLAVHPMNYGYWRSGHYTRFVPSEYFNSIQLKKNVISEANDYVLLKQIWLISRMPLNTPGRFQAIINYNIGRISQDAKRAFQTYPYIIDISPYVNQNSNLWLKQDS